MTTKQALSKINWLSLAFGALAVGAGGVAGLLISEVSNPLMVFASVAGLLAVFGMLLRPELGLLALIFMIYTRFSDVLVDVHGLPSIAKLFVPLLLLIILVRWGVYGQRLENWKLPTLLLAGYGLIGFSSLLYAAEPARVQDALVVFVKDAVILLIIVLLLQRGATLRRVIWTLLAAGIFLGTLSTYQQLTGTFDNDYWGFGQVALKNIVSDTGASGYRIGGPGLGPNGYGRYLLLVVPLALDRLWNEKRILWRILAAWAFAVSVLSIFFTFSRGTFLALVVVLIVMFVRRPPKPLVMLFTILVTAVLLQYLPTQYTQRLAGLTKLLPGNSYEAEADISFRGRLSENISAWDMFLDQPLLGVGLENFNFHYQDYSRRLGLDPRREERSPHNLYLEIMSELGLVGLFWFIGLQWITFKGLQQARKDFLAAGMPDYAGISLAMGAAIIGFLVTGIFLHVAQPRFFWLLYGIALAIPHVAKRELKEAFSNLRP